MDGLTDTPNTPHMYGVELAAQEDLDELCDRLEELEERHHRFAISHLSLMIGTFLAVWIIGKRLDTLELPDFRDTWNRERLEELGRIVHLHIHPEEITH